LTPPSATSPLRLVAGMTVALHAAGLVFAVLTMRPGTPGAPLLERIAYLAARPPGWTAGWLVWMACAVSLALLLRVLARVRPSPALRRAARIATAGAALDLVCDALYIWELPARAAGEVSRFVSFERALGMASLTGANGLYTLAIAIASSALPITWTAPRRLGALTVAGGIVMAVGGATGAAVLVVAGTAVTVPAFAAWALLVAAADRRA
jgi:hypothetical protein